MTLPSMRRKDKSPPMFRSLYIHFPFCETKCHYCDFYSLGAEKTRESDKTLFAKSLHQELDLRAPRLAPQLDTIFFGGGTPSMTDPDVMQRILTPLWAQTTVGSETEWTLEANPSSVDRARLSAYRSLGVNRISMGVQALKDDLLKSLGRVHTREAALRSLSELFEAGFTRVSVDLLCGVPGQSLDDLGEAIQTLTSFPVDHLSCYILTLPPHHRMYPQLPSSDVQLEHYLFVNQAMENLGFEQYEISNYSRPGSQARHNLSYWKGDSYLGLGPSAHSFDATLGMRWKNYSSIHRYGTTLEKKELPTEWSETLTEEQKHLEKWMLALRLSEGFPTEWLTDPRLQSKAQQFRVQGWLEPHPNQLNRLRLTPRGMALSDGIIRELAV